MTIEDRVARLQHRLRGMEVAGAILLAPSDLYYFANTAQQGTLLIPTIGEPALLTIRDFERARAESPLKDARHSTSFSDIRDVIFEKGLARDVLGLAMDILPTATFLRLKSLLPDAEFVDITRPMRESRMIKDAEEIAKTRQSAKLLDYGHEVALRLLKPGISELEISEEIELEMVRQGADGYCYPRNLSHFIRVVNVASGPSLSAPHSMPTTMPGPGASPLTAFGPSRRKFQAGDTVVVDIAGSYNGYIADQARTYSLGKTSNEQLAIAEAVRYIIEETLPAFKPGVRASEIFRTARAAANKTPFAEHFLGGKQLHINFVGHGVGLELDELPMLAPRDDTILAPNMTIAFEPIIMVPDVGAATLENTVLLTDSGYELITTRPIRLIEL